MLEKLGIDKAQLGRGGVAELDDSDLGSLRGRLQKTRNSLRTRAKGLGSAGSTFSKDSSGR